MNLRVGRPAAILRPRWRSISPVGAGGAAVALAAGFALACHSHLVFSQPPVRLVWWWGLVLLVAAVLRPVTRRLVGWVMDNLGRATVVPVALGTAIAVWWGEPAADMLWVNRGAAGPLRLLLVAAHAVLAAVIAGGVLAALAATDPPSQQYSPIAAGKPWRTMALFAVAAGGFAGWYVSRESAVYYADFMFYWTQASDWTNTLARSPTAGWDAFRRSVQQPGYTLLPAVLPAATESLFGDHRAVYVVTVAGGYLTALAAAAGYFVRATAGPQARLTTLTPAVLLLTMPLAWGPVVRGFPDVGGAALWVLAAGVYLGRPRTALRWSHLLAVAALLAGMALYRRWYNFAAVAFVAAAGLDAACGMIRPLCAGRWADAARELRPAFAVGGLFAALLLAFALPMVVVSATADYGDAFAGYRGSGPLADRLFPVIRRMGTGYWAAAGLALVALLFSRSGRRPAVFVAVQVPVVLALFYRVQDMDGHHMYLLLPAVLLLPAMALVRLFGRLPGWAGGIGLTLIGGTAAVGAAAVLTPDGEAWRYRLFPLGSTAHYPPLTRSDRPEFERLLDAVSERTADGGRFYLLSSSTELHSSMFVSAERSLRRPFPAAGRQEPTAEVDRVNGFPVGLFRAGYVLLADPVQLHMRASEQQTVFVPHRLLFAGTGVGRAFEVLPDQFRLQNGVSVRLFRRVRPIPPADFEAFCEELRAAHPTRPFVYRPAGDPAALLAVP